MHRGLLQQDPQLIELVDLREIEWAHLPAVAELYVEKPLPLQSIKRLSHRCAAGPGAFCNLGFGEPVSRQQLKFEEFGFELFVGGISQLLRTSFLWHRD